MTTLTTEVPCEGGSSEILIHGKHPRIQHILRTVNAISNSDSTVLIQGESGTGKDLFARLIHLRSRRKDGPWVPLNCGAIPSELMESEIFGHVRGAFTGATEDKAGLFQVASGGTLFLDEIGELPLSLQVKLLHVLQSGQVRAVGGTSPVAVNSRVIAATNRDLKAEVQKSNFRLDLYYRLNVIGLELPALRDRTADVPDLVEAISQRLQKRGIYAVPFSDEALELLMGYSWPGNIRELENVVERLLIYNSHGEVNAAAVREQLQNLEVSSTAAAPGIEGEGPRYAADRTLREVEKDHILRVLQSNGGNKTQSARVLGINVKTLYNKLKSYEND